MWEKDKRNGKGKYYDKNGNLKYQGDFIDDKYNGKGKYVYEDGYYYIGEFKNDQKNGRGREYDKNGNVLIEGDFVDDKYKRSLDLDNLEEQFEA